VDAADELRESLLVPAFGLQTSWCRCECAGAEVHACCPGNPPGCFSYKILIVEDQPGDWPTFLNESPVRHRAYNGETREPNFLAGAGKDAYVRAAYDAIRTGTYDLPDGNLAFGGSCWRQVAGPWGLNEPVADF